MIFWIPFLWPTALPILKGRVRFVDREGRKGSVVFNFILYTFPVHRVGKESFLSSQKMEKSGFERKSEEVVKPAAYRSR